MADDGLAQAGLKVNLKPPGRRFPEGACEMHNREEEEDAKDQNGERAWYRSEILLFAAATV